MKHSQLRVGWPAGLHLRPAARLVRLAQSFHSTIVLRANGRMANARSIVSVLLLCAALGTVVDVEAAGEDEEQALQALAQAFDNPDNSLDHGTDSDSDSDPSVVSPK